MNKGPLITLAAGALTAAVLVVLSVNAVNASETRKAAQRDSASASPSSSPSPSDAAPTPSPSTPAQTPPAADPSATPPTAGTPIAYAGRVNGSKATVAIVVNGAEAVAYICDGNKVEAWLKGAVEGQKVELTGEGGATLSATVGGGKATGSVTAAGRTFTFAVPGEKAPAGLYRAAATIRGAKVVGGWIVLRDGTQIGVLSTDGRPAPAPLLDLTTGAAQADGSTITARPVDGSGF